MIVNIPWDKFRDSDGYINLIKAYEFKYSETVFDLEHDYLKDVMSIQPTKSRQVASIAIVTAYYLNKDK